MKSRPLLTTLSLLFVTAVSLSAVDAAEKSQEQLKTEAKVSEKEAAANAHAKVPHGKIKSSELEEENGKLVWPFDISMPKSRSITDIQVGIRNGRIVSTQVESPEDQAKEAEADKKEHQK